MIKKEVEIKDKNLIKIKFCHSPISTTSETYEFKMVNLKSGLPKETPNLVTNFDKAAIGTVNSPTVRKIAFLGTLLGGKALKKYYLIVANFCSTTVKRLQEIGKGLLKYFFPRNVLAKQKRAMRCIIRNPRGIKLWQFVARLQELNNLHPKFTGSYKSKNVFQEELNDILLHDVLHVWANQAMMIGFDFDSEPLHDVLELFKRMEVAESIYEGAGAPSQTKHPRMDSNRYSGQNK